MKITRYILVFVFAILCCLAICVQNHNIQHITKKCEAFFFVSIATKLKKIFISIMAVVAMFNLCSCSKEFIDNPDSAKAIVFDNVQTRAIVSSAIKFSAWAYLHR